MKDFKEYIEEKEFDEMLNEEVVTAALAILAIPTAVALATWGASVVVTAYVRVMSKIIDGIVRTWRNLFSGIRGMITRERVAKNIKEMSKNSKVKRVIKETKEKQKKFANELSEVYAAIDAKDWQEAKEQFNELDKNMQNNPEVQKVIISEISRVMKDPPLYIQSPGNKSYQAIKKVINIRVARAAAEASRLAIERSLADDKTGDNEEKETENEEE